MTRYSSLLEPPLGFLSPCLPVPGAGAFFPTIMVLLLVFEAEDCLSLVKVGPTIAEVDELAERVPVASRQATSTLDNFRLPRFLSAALFPSLIPADSHLRLIAELG